MRVRVKEEGRGIHPNEVVVSVPTTSGPERLVVHRRSLEDGGIEIGYPILVQGDSFLVELPRETMRGLWRVWVASSALLKERQTA